MNKLFVQVFRGGAWCNVTSVAIDPAYGRDADRQYARAYRLAMQQLAGWRGYFTEPLRIAEEMARGGYKEARP